MKKILFFMGICLFFESVVPEDISFINSDNTRYTKDNVYCLGNVIIVYCNRVISADKVFYDKSKNTVCAKGNVIIKDERQNVYFMDSLSVGKNFHSGAAKNIKIIMEDKSRLAARECTIKNGKYDLVSAIYSPCYECTEQGEITWQVKSDRVIFDPERYTEYQNAKFELFGTPIFYTPYLSHISPKIKRKSGFLVPEFSSSSKSGFSVLPQYLCSISDSQELILKPIITSKIGHVGWVYYGIRFPNGEFNIDASITNDKSVSGLVSVNNSESTSIQKIKDSGYRGHIFSKARYEINNIWRCSFDVNLASDRYYLNRFPFFNNENRVLESNAKLEGFDGNNYTSIKTAMFQSEQSQGVPRVLPMVERNYSHDLFYGTFNLDSYFINLDFNNHRSAQKVVSNASWSKKILLPFGNIFDCKGVVFLRSLNVSEKEHSEYDSSFMAMPQVSFAWKWPLVFHTNYMSTIFSPIGGLIIAGNRKCSDIFEDSFSEINDVNFLEGNRGISSYNIDSGKRIYYGANVAGYKDGENLYRFIIGRATELTSFQDRLDATGLKNKHSNIVASADIFLSEGATLIMNGNYSTQTKRFLRIEIGVCFSNKKVDFDIMAFNGKQCFYDPFSIASLTEEQKTQKYKGIMFDAGLYITNTTKLKAGIIIGNEHDKLMNIDQSANGHCKLIKHHIGIGYKNECAEVDFVIERKNYNIGDLKPETVFRFIVHLKNLGI